MQNVKKNILVIDDVTYVRMLFAHSLTEKGFNVFQAKNGYEGLEIFKKTNIDVVLLDLVLGDIDGVKFLELMRDFEAKKGINNVPVILITAFNYESRIKEAVQYGIINVLYKPINLELLLDEVNEALNGKESLKDKLSKTILVVETERISREKLENALKKEGYNAIVVSSGAQALDVLKRIRPDIAVINPELKDIDGLYLLSGMTRLRSESNIITVLNEIRPELISYLNKIGIVDIVHKPININFFIDKIKSIIKERDLIANYNVSKDLFLVENFDFGNLELLKTFEEE